MSNSKQLFVFLALVLFIAIRWPFINFGLPYLYNEDEAHHFNRIVRMVQSGDLNPHYFHKPSLHFYVRIPVLVASFFYSVRSGQIKSIKSVETNNSYGLAGYNFTASHPALIKWQRLFSVLLSLSSVLLIVLLAKKLKLSSEARGLIFLLATFSPGLILYDQVIGVDVLMLFMAVLTAYTAVEYYEKGGVKLLVLLSLLAGLCVSSKYNALPIAMLPFISCILRKEKALTNILVSLCLPALGFLLGSPAILTSLPLFMDQFAYEIWHYGIAGHEGHTAQPGIAQVVFYFTWLAKFAVGCLVLIFSLLAFFRFIKDKNIVALIIFAFPVLFFILMSLQKANFERNIVAIIPFMTLSAVAFVDKLKLNKKMKLLLFLLLLIQPLVQTVVLIKEKTTFHESRKESKNWLEQNTSNEVELAISGSLQLEKFSYFSQGEKIKSLAGVDVLDFNKNSLDELYQAGYSRLVLGYFEQLKDFDSHKLIELKTFEGIKDKQRLVENPAIRILDFKKLLPADIKEDSIDSFSVVNSKISDCGDQEQHCWLSKKFTRLEFLDLKPRTIKLNIMSPWQGQKISFWSNNKLLKSYELTEAGKFQDFDLDLANAVEDLIVEVAIIHNPAARSYSSDNRRLGLAIKDINIR